MRHASHHELDFYRRLFSLSLPIILQNLITISLGFVDTFMVSLLGQDELSAVTAANSPIFLVQMVVFGILSGLSVLAGQYWRKGDTEAINCCMGVALYAGLALTGAVALTLFIAPRTVMGLITNHLRLIDLGGSYIRIVGFSYVFGAASSVYVGMQRSVENPIMGTAVFTCSMLLNTVLNYVLIFGHFGAPALGVTGAAAATLISRIAEFAITAVYALRCRWVPLRPGALPAPGRAILRSFVTTPVLVNDAFWGLGTTVMTAIMGHMVYSAGLLAAYAVIGNIDQFATVFCFGVATVSSVMIGKSIGSSREETCFLARRLMAVSFYIGCAVALCLTALLPARSPANTIITGTLRAWGDVQVATIIDLVPLWLIAVPFTTLTGLVLNAPVAVVCLYIRSENIYKLPLSLLRLRSRRWINDVTEGGVDS